MKNLRRMCKENALAKTNETLDRQPGNAIHDCEILLNKYSKMRINLKKPVRLRLMQTNFQKQKISRTIQSFEMI